MHRIEALLKKVVKIENEIKFRLSSIMSSNEKMLQNLQQNKIKKLVQHVEFQKTNLKQMIVESKVITFTYKQNYRFI